MSEMAGTSRVTYSVGDYVKRVSKGGSNFHVGHVARVVSTQEAPGWIRIEWPNEYSTTWDCLSDTIAPASEAEMIRYLLAGGRNGL